MTTTTTTIATATTTLLNNSYIQEIENSMTFQQTTGVKTHGDLWQPSSIVHNTLIFIYNSPKDLWMNDSCTNTRSLPYLLCVVTPECHGNLFLSIGFYLFLRMKKKKKKTKKPGKNCSLLCRYTKKHIGALTVRLHLQKRIIFVPLEIKLHLAFHFDGSVNRMYS